MLARFKKEAEELKGKQRLVISELKRAESVIVKLQKQNVQQEQLFTFLRKYLLEKDVRMVYKIVGLQLPADLKETMIESGAKFFEVLASNKANTHETKVMHTSLGLLETGKINKNITSEHPDTGKFDGGGLQNKNKLVSEEDLREEIVRLQNEVDYEKMLNSLSETEQLNLHMLTQD
jgi:hypothetical protein